MLYAEVAFTEVKEVEDKEGNFYRESIIYGKEPIQETRFERIGDLFRFSQKKFGRCISHVYVDRGGPESPRKSYPIGWVFLSRQKYEDTGKPFLREAWVTVHQVEPTVVRTQHLLDVSTGQEMPEG